MQDQSKTDAPLAAGAISDPSGSALPPVVDALADPSVTTSAELAVARDLARNNHLAANAERRRLLGEREAITRGRGALDHKALDGLDAKIASASAREGREGERAEGLTEALGRAVAEETEVKRRAGYRMVVELTPKALAAIRHDYERGVKFVRSALRRIAEVRIAVAAVNANLPAGQPALPDPETDLRARQAKPRHEVSRRRAKLWVRSDDGKPYAPEFQAKIIRQQDGSGVLHSRHGGQTSGIDRREFDVVEYAVEERGEYFPDLAATLHLPPLSAGEAAGWEPEWAASPQAILDRLTALSDLPAVADRPRRVEVEYARPMTPGANPDALSKPGTVVKTLPHGIIATPA